MMNLTKLMNRRVCLLLFPLVVLLTSTGCIEQMAQILYVVKGHKLPPAYAGLDGKQVAVVCVSDQSAYGPDTLTYTVSKYVSVKLSQGLKKAKIVSPAKIENWIDQNGWDNSRVTALGEALEAEMVVVVEVGSYSIHEGATIYKGRADLSVTVYDISKDGQVAFVHGPEPHTFPKDGRPAIQTSEREFETFYLARLTDHISKLFVEHDKLDNFADDAMLN